VEFPIPLCLEEWLAFDKARHPALAHAWRRRILAAASEQSVCHSSYVDDMRGKSTTIKVKDPLNKGLLFNRVQLAVDMPCRVLWEHTLKARS
jgi:hypothetical protein